MKKPTALIFSTKRYYVSPSFNLLLKCLSEVFEVTFYGPGYTDPKLAEDDFLAVFNKIGPFDAVFIDQTLYSNPERNTLEEFLTVPDTVYFTRKAKKFVSRPKMGVNFSKIPAKKFLFAWLDPYSCTSEEAEDIKNFPGVIVGWPLYLMKPKRATHENIQKEKFPFSASNNYFEGMSNRENDLIPFCHIIDEEEFIKKSNAFLYDISVPGCQYYARKRVSHYLKEFRDIRSKEKENILEKIELLFYLLNFNINNKFLFIKMRQFFFRKLILKSFCSFTDGSQFGYPVRKFFEIPAMGSILLCEPFENYERMGFIDGENFFSASSSNIIEIYSELRKNPVLENSVREKALDLIKKNHSKTAWVNYLREIWRSIDDDNFGRCEWTQGKIKIKKKS